MMIPAILRKFGFALLWIWIISLLAFWLSKQVPGDEYLDYLSLEQGGFNTALNPSEQRIAITQVAEKRGFNLPQFYFSMHKGIYPDTLYRIIPGTDRDVLKRWISESRNPKSALRLFTSARKALTFSCQRKDLHSDSLPMCSQLHYLLSDPDLPSVRNSVKRLAQQALRDSLMREPELFEAIAQMEKRSEELESEKSLPLTALLPGVRWNGTNNQYHHWISGFVNRKPLTSLMDGRDAWTKIFEALKLTLLINGLAFFLAVWIGILIGKWSALHDGTTFEKWISIILFALFAIPSFWLATLLIFFFSSGEWLSLFPTGGLGRIEQADNFFSRLGILLHHLILPVSCLALGVLAYVSRQMKQSVKHELSQPFVGALRTMGVSEKTIVNKHVMRNAWFPLITMIGKSFPELISGSMIVEVIFSIPGMGRLMYTSLLARDWPVVFPILMLVATVTILAYTVADIIYKAVDPRVKTLE